MAQAFSRQPPTAEPRIQTRPVYVEFAVGKIALGQLHTIRVLRLPPVSVFHQRFILVHHRSYIVLTTDSTVK
jgi:hypothetical protein